MTDDRLSDIDWDGVSDALDERGYAVIPALLSPARCAAIARLYEEESRFRKKVVMTRHGYGSGEYQYFAYPLPGEIAALRGALYPPLAAIANRWQAALGHGGSGREGRFPDTHDAYLERCHAAGQARPTPLLLRYREGDYNRLHQDVYGELLFPMQAIVLLSEPGRRSEGGDFTGGELIVTEQRPRMQARAEIVPLAQGDAAIVAVRDRPGRGARGAVKMTMRHGVSRVRSGERRTLGLIFHDAA